MTAFTGGPSTIRDALHPAATLLILLGALCFNAALCFANTSLFAVNDLMVMAMEGLLISLAFCFAVGRSVSLYLVLALFLSYAALLMALRPMVDPKAVRDFMIPIAFYALGRRCPDPRLADRAALASGVIVAAMGLFEFIALDTYVSFFNIIRYYVARGTVAPSDVSDQTGALFQSGMRPDARTLLPFLGPHRASSVFLEPVSTGNFGAILFLWAIFRKGMRFRWTLALLGVTAIVLADARFGAYVSIAATMVFVVSGRMPRAIWVALPFGILAILAVYGLTTAEKTWTNDIGGRMLWTSMLLTSLDASAVFGLSPDKPFLSDSGYAYTLNQIGLIGFFGLWTLFILLPDASRRAWRFKAAAATYLCLLMLISDSLYSIKTAALFWFMLGISGGADPRLYESRPRATSPGFDRPTAGGLATAA